MSRFDHLEMGNWHAAVPDEDPAEAGLIDQHFYIEKAAQAFADENYERALAYYSRALQYDANMEEAWLGQLRCLLELQELQEAIIWSDRALERFPKSGSILAARAVAEARLGHSIAAMGYSDAAFKEARESTPYMWVARGEVLITVNIKNAKACFMKAVELAPQDWTVRAWIGRSYLTHRCHHQALEHLRNAVKLDPDRVICWYWIGKCCEMLGEIEEAQRAYARAMSIQPSFSRARDALLQIRRRGIVSKVFDAFKRVFVRRQVSEG